MCFERLHFRNAGPGRGGCSPLGMSTGTHPPPHPRPGHCVLRRSVSSLHVQSDGPNGPSSQDLDSCARRERPFAGLRPPASPPSTPPLQPQRGSLQNCPAAPIPPGRCGNSVVGLAGACGPKVSNVAGVLQVPHCQGRCAQFPRPGRPQAAESGRASVRAAGQGYFSKTLLLHHRSCGR